MALPTASPPSQRNPQVVGAAFVQQYYQVLHCTPEMVYKFYLDCSMLSRPDSNGVMLQVTTLQDIKDNVLPFKFDSYIAEIETVDSQASYMEGVFIVVTGCLTASDNVRRKFTQSFFLAPQDKGYFVQNDIFRFVDQSQPMEPNQVLANGDIDEAPKASITASPEPDLDQENEVEDLPTLALEEDLSNHEEAAKPSENCGSGVEDETQILSPVTQSQSSDHPNNEAVNQDSGSKKSYASIVKVMGTPPKKVSVPAMKPKANVTPPSAEKPLSASAVPSNESEAKIQSSTEGPKNKPLDAEGYSIHIRNLPSNTTTELVEAEMKKFGPIKPGGVQVRNHKIDNFCYGFVEFESQSSMQAAIKASPISIGGRPSYIEEKRTSTRVVNGVVISSNNGRGRFPPGRGGFRSEGFRGNDNMRASDNFRGNDRANDNFRGNGNGNFRRNDNFQGRGGGSFGGNNQGYGRSDFRGRGDFSGRIQGRGHPGYAREGYQQRPIQNGGGRVGRPVPVTA